MEAKIVSSLVKCFSDSNVSDFPELTRISVLKNERLSFQLVYKDDRGGRVNVSVSSPLADKITVRTVESIPSAMPAFPDSHDDNYISTSPGLFPDLLLPTQYGVTSPVLPGECRSVWFECALRSDFVGECEIKVTLSRAETVSENVIMLNVIDAELPAQELILTQWFHCDCLANYYNVAVFSKEHWRIIENFAATARKNGINMLLTPIFTPPLDTAPGGERLTVQLVGVKVRGGKYSFDFSLLGRWIDMCRRVGIEYYEISHLFTQWGAGHAPKIIADADGEYRRIFGWETDSCGEEYRAFLAVFIPRLLSYLKRRGVDKRCYFHISDEPSDSQLEQYKAAKSGVAKLLRGYPIMDALSSFEFYRHGVIEHPIPSCDHIEPFYSAGVKDLWTYYCCGQNVDVPNRFFAMPSARNRIIGMLFYKYNIKGFLQWGYNFYNNCSSVNAINPYLDSTGGCWVPSGDAYSVYPAQDGSAYESLRIVVFHEALQDLRALKLCESLYSREFVLSLLEEGLDAPLSFKSYPKSDEYILCVREKLNNAIKAAKK